QEVFEIYRKSHFILLPSDSEGFPKVIAEAMNYGCIPIVSDVSSIGQYVTDANGFLLKPINAQRLREMLQVAISKNTNELTKMSTDCYLVASKFTFANYRQKVQDEIIKY